MRSTSSNHLTFRDLCNPLQTSELWYRACNRYQQVKVRIKSLPQEREIDGVRLDHFERGSVREVSSSIGNWLVAQGYAELEMRHDDAHDAWQFNGPKSPRETVHDHPRRRRTDR